MKSLILILAILGSAYAQAEPRITAINPSGNVLFCADAEMANSSYESALATLAKLKAKFAGVPAGSEQEKNALKIIAIGQSLADSSAESAKSMDAKPMVWIGVDMDRARTIPADRVNDEKLAIQKVKIDPSSLGAGGVSIPAQSVQLTFYSLGFCAELAKANGDVNAAVAAAVNQLFAD